MRRDSRSPLRPESRRRSSIIAPSPTASNSSARLRQPSMQMRPTWSCSRASCESSRLRSSRVMRAGCSTSTLRCCPLIRASQTHRRALADGVRIHGCTVHFVTSDVDCGPIVAQAAVTVRQGDDEASARRARAGGRAPAAGRRGALVLLGPAVDRGLSRAHPGRNRRPGACCRRPRTRRRTPRRPDRPTRQHPAKAGKLPLTCPRASHFLHLSTSDPARASLAVAALASLAVHIALLQSTIRLPDRIEESPPLLATITELPPPPASVEPSLRR